MNFLYKFIKNNEILKCYQTQQDILVLLPLVCSRRLGMESEAIKDNQISATTYYKYENNHPTRGRLHHSGCWKSAHVLNEEWLQVDLLTLHTITGLITQGRGKSLSEYFVKTYALSFESRYRRGSWRTYRDVDGTEKVLNYLQATERYILTVGVFSLVRAVKRVEHPLYLVTNM